jgi:NADH-quinone oxidoreductase subunit N
MPLNLLQDLQSSIWQDSLAFLPELLICGTIVLLLLLRLFRGLDRLHLGGVALGLTVLALITALYQWRGQPGPPGGQDQTLLGWLSAVDRWLRSVFDPRPRGVESLNLFSGLLVYDNFTIFLKLFLLGFASLLVWLSLLTGIPDREDSGDFYVLLLGATLGMMLMASANHLLMVFLAIEMASLPSYALAGFLKGRRQSSEAALKYVVYGGGAAGVMLYGISLVAGKYGTGYLPELALALSQAPSLDPLMVLGVLFILIGFGFKLAAVPFHFWCPDVFEGAAAEIAGFLSVASKGAALALTGRFALMLTGLAVPGLADADPAKAAAAWQNVAPFLAPALGLVAAVTATFGNLAAFVQTNLKRLLAYSTIAHAGYMLMGLATLTREGAAAVLFYLVAYLFMNLGAFAVVAFLRNRTGSEDLADFRGLGYRAPLLVFALAVCLLSLLGLPPLAGFMAKFQIFQVLFSAGQLYVDLGLDGVGYLMYALLVIAGLNSVLSLFYYVKVLRVMVLERPLEEVEGREPRPLPVPPGADAYALLMAVLLLVTGILWGPLYRESLVGVKQFGQAPSPASLARGER